MIPYIFLMFAPLLFYQIAIMKDDKSTGKGWFISIGKEPRILNNSLIVPVFFLLLFVLLSLRDETIGRDTLNYKNFFRAYSLMAFDDLYKVDMEFLFVLLNWLIGKVTDSYQVFLTIISAIILLPIAVIYSQDKQYGFLKIVLFMNMSVFVMLFSGIRQSLAMAVGMIAYHYVREKKPFRFLLLALIAMGFHHTGFMVLLYYPLYYLRLRKNHLWFFIPLVGTVFAFNKQIFMWLTNVAATVLGEKYEAEIEETGAYLMIILFALFAIAAFFFPDEEKIDAEMNGLRNFLLIALLLQCFAPVHTLAMRINYYFIIFIPVIVPKIFKYSKDNFKEVANVVRGVIIVFFVAYYLYTTYVSCQTGESALNTYPYVPFWEN